MHKLTARYQAASPSLKSILLAFLISVLGITSAHSAWFDRLVPQGETYTVTEVDRDLAFVIDGFIYDARRFCYMEAGDKVVFFEGRHGTDYRATVYNLQANERCEVLLRRKL